MEFGGVTQVTVSLTTASTYRVLGVPRQPAGGVGGADSQLVPAADAAVGEVFVTSRRPRDRINNRSKRTAPVINDVGTEGPGGQPIPIALP